MISTTGQQAEDREGALPPALSGLGEGGLCCRPLIEHLKKADLSYLVKSCDHLQALVAKLRYGQGCELAEVGLRDCMSPEHPELKAFPVAAPLKGDHFLLIAVQEVANGLPFEIFYRNGTSARSIARSFSLVHATASA